MAESYIDKQATCPCGCGEIYRTLTDYNKMYVSPDFSVSCSCGTCNVKYRISDHTEEFQLTDRKELERKTGESSIYYDRQKIFRRTHCDPIACKIEALARTAGRTKKLWYRTLSELLSDLGVRSFDDFCCQVHQAGNFSIYCLWMVNENSIEAIATFLDISTSNFEVELETLKSSEPMPPNGFVVPVPRTTFRFS